MARTFDALIALLALYSSLANAALYGRNETTVAGSGTIGTGGITSLTTFSTSSTLSRSSTSLTLTLTPKSSTNTTAQGTSSTTSSSTTTTLVGTGGKTTSSTSSTSAKSITSSGGTGIGTGPTTGGTTSTSSSSSSSNSITLIPTTISSGSIIETSTITSTLSHSGTTTTSSSQTSTATGFPIVTNGQCKGPDCNNGACTGILCISLGCSGSGCANGICTGLDCISLGCIGGGCSNGVCIGSCVTSGCEGSDCDTTTGECSGSDCISVGCSGPDCDSSTGSCSGPNCSTETCSGTDCDKGSCTGSGCDDEGTQTGGGTDAPTDNPTSPTSSTLSSTSSSSSSCSTETATLCAAACSVVAVPDASNTTTTLSTSCYTTACSATAACSVEDTTTSSLTTLTSTPSGACMTVIPFSAIASPGSVVSTSYSATAITYTIATVTANSTSSTGTGTNSGNTVTSSAITTSSSSSITSASASTVACTYQGADPDQGIDGYCICSSSTYSMLTGTSGNLCAYTALPTSTAVITASPLYTTTQNCYVCTVYGEANEDCLLMSGCTPTSTTTVATTSASTTTTTSPRVTCTLWTDCPPCPSGESEICAGTGGQETCGCITESSKFRLRRDYEPKARRKDYRLSRPDRPLARRADDDGDALSCPYEPPAEDTYCTATGLSKRANAAKELNLPWVSGMKWSNYPQCPNTGNAGITQVPQFYYPAGASPLQNGIQSYDPTSAQDASTNGLIAGIAQSQFANDHVFEAQLVSGFLSWLCGQPSITSYTQIPWPAGWTQPDTQWCAAVFGSDADAKSGFLFTAFPGDTTGNNNFLGNCGEVTGGVSNPGLMAIYYGPANGWKGKITKAQWPAFSTMSGTAAQQQEQAGVIIRDAANVFQYLRDATIQGAWTTPSQSIETVCVQFDNNFWGSAFAASAQGTALAKPANPQGVTNWGLRTLWVYWIDNHLYRIEQQVPSWVATALTKVGGAGGGFAQNYMQANGMVSASQMRFPLDANMPNAPIPGTQGSATNTVSRYMMWNGTVYGAPGL